MFRNASQRDDETIEQFITRLRQKAETCKFTKVEEHIRDQIIEKCNSNALHQKFLEKGKELNLEMLTEIARSYETAAAQIENFAKPEEVKQKERENVNRLLKKSSAGRFANFIIINLNGIIEKNVFVAEKLIIERNILIVRQETVNVLNAIKRHYARCCKTKLAQNKNKEFKGPFPLKARFHYERGKEHSLFVLLIFVCARFNFNRSVQSKINKRNKECSFPRS